MNNEPFLVLGDLHGRLDIIKKADQYCIKHDIKQIIQVGDFGCFWPPDPCPIIDYFNKKPTGPEWSMILGNHDCLSPDTECLVKYKGWQTYENLQKGDLVCSMDPETRSANWVPIEEVILKDGIHDMISYDTCRNSFSVTANHNMFGWPGGSIKSVVGEPGFIQAKDLPYTWNIAMCANRVTGLRLDPNLARLAGIILSDGCFNIRKKYNKNKARNTTIYQSKDPEPIRKILRDAQINWTETIRNRSVKKVCGKVLKKPPLPQRAFHISASSRPIIDTLLQERYRLPQWAWECDVETFNALLNGLMIGDGSHYHDKVATTQILYGKKLILDDIQAIALNHGWTASVTKDTRGASRLNLCNNPIRTIHRNKVTREKYEGIVWCLSVPPYRNFLVRRNGKAHFTGNCYQVFNVLQAEQDAAGAPYEPNSYVRYSHRLIAQKRASYRNGMAFCGGAVSSDANPGFRYNPMMDKMVKYEGRVEGKDWWRDEAPTRNELQAFLDCIELNKPHTIFTHDGPQFAHTARGSEINLKSGLRTDEISRAFETIAKHSDWKPSRWFFGHHHELTTVTLNGTSYYCCGLHGEGYLVGDTVEEFRI